MMAQHIAQLHHLLENLNISIFFVDYISHCL